ncbi:MAG TPA: LysE family translocator [Devosia sp.]|nr:LysE family translocator [Devosia sp.]
MPDIAVLVPYTIAAFVVVAVPGITVSTVVSTALARGLAPAYWLELGAAMARLSMVIVVAVALEAVTGVVSALFDIIKYVGAAYLAYLGWGYLTSRGGIKLREAAAQQSPWRQTLTGFLTLWSNPKALLFFGAFIPQFVDARYAAWPQVLVLGLIEIGAAFVTDSGYIALSVGARSLLTGGALVWVNRIAGVILMGAAVWLATLSRG